MQRAERFELRGTTLDGRYRVGPLLGVGGTAVVHTAERIDDGARLVVKTLREQFVTKADLVMRLRREAEVAARVAHPGIVPVVDSGMLPDGTPYLVLERLEGECLARMLRRMGPLPPHAVAAIVARAAAILHSVHAAGYVHRDVKPEHIVMDRRTDGGLDVRLLDFGVCASSTSSVEERDVERGRVYGTPSYVSPEQASGKPEVDGRADVFSLGIVMFEAIVGRVPFAGSNVANLLRRIIREDAPRAGLLLPDLDLRYDAVIARAMARVPDLRFPSARALTRGLIPLMGDRAETERWVASQVRNAGSRISFAPTRPDPNAAKRAAAA